LINHKYTARDHKFKWVVARRIVDLYFINNLPNGRSDVEKLNRHSFLVDNDSHLSWQAYHSSHNWRRS